MSREERRKPTEPYLPAAGRGATNRRRTRGETGRTRGESTPTRGESTRTRDVAARTASESSRRSARESDPGGERRDSRENTRRGVGVDPQRPPRQAAAATAPAGTATRGPTRRLKRLVKIIVIDPDRFSRAALARALVRGHCAVQPVDSIEDAREAIEAIDDFEVIIADVDASATAKILKLLLATRPQLPVLLWTSRKIDPQNAVDGLDLRRAEWIDKAALPSDVLDAVQRLARV